MKIISWNVNSVRARIENIKHYIKDSEPDVLMLQEIKTQNENFPNDEFKNYVNYNSVIWQALETNYWKNKLKNLINEHLKETNSEIAKKILDDFNSEVKNFIQVCPKEMLDKLSNPLTLKQKISEVV